MTVREYRRARRWWDATEGIRFVFWVLLGLAVWVGLLVVAVT